VKAHLLKLTGADKILDLNTPRVQTVDYERGFHFFYESGNYSGETATSMITFGFILETISVKSIRYHLGRRDFQNWIKTTLDDDVLSGRIDRIRIDVSDQELRDRLMEVINRRLQELSTGINSA
jgi:hypothetical protein